MSTAYLCCSRALPVAALLLCVSCAVGAPKRADDPFFEEELGDDEAEAADAAPLDAEVDAAMIDPTLIIPPLLDAALPIPGANVPDAASAAPRGDAGSGRDAATSTPARDASTARPPTSTFDASTPSSGGACDPFTCTNTCSVAGPFNCCTLFDTCGCTWAPGAYCL